MMKKLTLNEAGFSLIEVLLATTIFAIGLFAVASMQVTALTQNSFSYARTGAASVAQNLIEDLQSGAFEDSTLVDTDGDGRAGLLDVAAAADLVLTDVAMGNRSYDVFLNISSNDPGPDVDAIGVTVQWQNKGTTRNISMTQIRGR